MTINPGYTSRRRTSTFGITLGREYSIPSEPSIIKILALVLQLRHRTHSLFLFLNEEVSEEVRTALGPHKRAPRLSGRFDAPVFIRSAAADGLLRLPVEPPPPRVAVVHEEVLQLPAGAVRPEDGEEAKDFL